MNFAQVMGLVRLALAAGGSAAIASALHTTPDAVSNVAAASSPGELIVGAVPLIAAAGWSLYAHTVGATVDRAVAMTTGPAEDGRVVSPLAAVAPAAKARAGVKTHLSPNG